MGLMDKAKNKLQDAGDTAKDMKKDLENRADKLENDAHEKKGEIQGRMNQADYDTDNS